MSDFIKALPAVILLLLGLTSLGLAVSWIMTGLPDFGALGAFAAIGAYLVAALVILKAFTN